MSLIRIKIVKDVKNTNHKSISLGFDRFCFDLCLGDIDLRKTLTTQKKITYHLQSKHNKTMEISSQKCKSMFKNHLILVPHTCERPT